MTETLLPADLPSVDKLDPALLLDLAAGVGSTATIAAKHKMTAVQLARIAALPAVKQAVEVKRTHLLRTGYNVEAAAEELLFACITELHKRVREGVLGTEVMLDTVARVMPLTGRSAKGAQAEQAAPVAPSGGGITIVFDQRGIEDARERGVTVDLPGAVNVVPAVTQ